MQQDYQYMIPISIMIDIKCSLVTCSVQDVSKIIKLL